VRHDPATLSVFLDFDGTITTADTGVHVLERFADPRWREVDAEYARGEIPSRACLLDEWDLLPHDRDLLVGAAAEVPLDPGFEPLVAALRAAGAEVRIVSDGFGLTVHEVGGALGIPVLANRVDWTTGTLEFPHEDRCCACSSCGTCKQAPIAEAARAGRTTVLIGDGTSDRKAALLADLVFAKAGLAAWCARHDVRFTPFETLADVHDALLGARG
jgi:2,3-diketo-5-methylthio-1-phosphopentane phosphatase